MMQNVRGDSGKIMGRLALAGEGCNGVGEVLLLRGRASTPAGPPRLVCARNKGKTRRLSAVIMVKSMQAREGRKGKHHGPAVIDIHLSVPANFEEAPGQQRLRGGGSALLAVHGVCGEWGRGL